MARLIGQISGPEKGLVDGFDEAIGLADLARQSGGDWFDRLVAENHQRVTRLVYRLLGWRGDVEDVVQDVFLAALKSGKNFREESSQWTWLAAIAINRCRTWRRRKILEFRWLRSAGRESVKESNSAVELEGEQDETCRRVREAVGELKPKDREVVVLFYLEDWSVAKICGVTGDSAGAVEVRLHRAREKLRGILGELM